MTIPSPGQIWREVGGDRFVRVIAFSRVDVKICTVKKNAIGDWQRTPRSRDTECRASRFDGKAGGYEFVEES